MIKLFRGGSWHVCFRERREENDRLELDLPFSVVPNPPNGWIADPFLFSHDDRLFLFAEYFINAKEKGVIGVSEYRNGEFTPMRQVIEELFHLSYPMVFAHEGSFYMIPESGQGGRIGLYRSANFPLEWEFAAEIASGGNFADTTLTKIEGGALELVSYQKADDCYRVFLIEFSLDEMRLVRCDSSSYGEDYCRPAGLPLTVDGRSLIPVQDCREKYGESIGLFPFDHTAGFAALRPVRVIDADSVSVAEEASFQRVHTFNRLGCFDVIDVFEERFDVLHAPKMLRRRIRSAALKHNRLRG